MTVKQTLRLESYMKLKKTNYLRLISFPQRLVLINYFFRVGTSLGTTVYCSAIALKHFQSLFVKLIMIPSFRLKTFRDHVNVIAKETIRYGKQRMRRVVVLPVF